MTDTVTVRIVVVALATLAIVGMAAVAWLLFEDVTSDRIAVLVALVGPSVGGLTGILASTRTQAQEPVPVFQVGQVPPAGAA